MVESRIWRLLWFMLLVLNSGLGETCLGRRTAWSRPILRRRRSDSSLPIKRLVMHSPALKESEFARPSVHDNVQVERRVRLPLQRLLEHLANMGHLGHVKVKRGPQFRRYERRRRGS